MSADELSFPRGLFSHVMSQSTLYHVHKREKAITKIYDVLKKDWIFVFEDFVRPNAFVSKDSMKYVYERLMYRTGFNHQNYQEFLQSLWFKIIEALDISTHMEKSYAFLTQICEEKLVSWKPEFMSEYKKLYEAYPYMVKAIQKGDLWWSFFVCKK